MALDITTITTHFILNVTVNCYLIKLDEGFILIDTAKRTKRGEVEQALTAAGCNIGDLKLIILTHGDFDHCSNAAYLRQKYGTKVTMHAADKGMVEAGNMLYNRKQPFFLMKWLMRLLFRLNPADQFTPDFYIKAGDTLAEYGFDVEIIEIPGHSKGSIGLLTATGEFICGDLLANTDKPDVWTIIDDDDEAAASVEKLKNYPITTVYPGHGDPFPMQAFWDNRA